MKLKKFLMVNDMSIQDLADALKASHETVRRYVHETRYPRPATAQKIVILTKGAVSLADIYGKSSRQEARP